MNKFIRNSRYTVFPCSKSSAVKCLHYGVFQWEDCGFIFYFCPNASNIDLNTIALAYSTLFVFNPTSFDVVFSQQRAFTVQVFELHRLIKVFWALPDQFASLFLPWHIYAILIFCFFIACIYVERESTVRCLMEIGIEIDCWITRHFSWR